MAEEEIAVGISEVHAVAAAVSPVFAAGTIVLAHPGTVPVGLVAVLPDVHEIVPPVDVALTEVGPDAWAGGY